jgi:hypothetical protein
MLMIAMPRNCDSHRIKQIMTGHNPIATIGGVNESSPTRADSSKLEPGQWTLRHLVIVLAVVAVGSAILGPWLRQISARQLAFAGLAAAMAVAVASFTFTFGMFLRKRKAAGAGRRLLQVQVKHWLAFNWSWWTLCFAALCGVGMVAVLILILPSKGEIPTAIAFPIAHQSLIAGMLGGLLLLWSANAACLLEVHDNGLLIQRSQFVPWGQITRMEWTSGPDANLLVQARDTRYCFAIDEPDRDAVRELIALYWSATPRPAVAEPELSASE